MGISTNQFIQRKRARDYYRQLKANNFSNLEIIDTFLKSHKLSKLAQEETENVNGSISTKKKKVELLF